MAPSLLENSVPIKLLSMTLPLAFEISSPLAEKLQSEKRDYKELFTRNGDSETLGSQLLYLKLATFACVTFNRISDRFLEADKIVTLTGNFKFKHWSIR